MATDRNQIIILVVVAALLIVAVSCFAAIHMPDSEPLDEPFTPPRFDETAMKEKPVKTSEYYKTIDLPIDNEKCVVAMDVQPRLSEDMLHVVVTSSADNTAWIRIVLYDGDQNVIGESGLIRPDEYVESIKLTKAVVSGEKLTAKVLTYEPDTYYSLGTANITIIVL